MRFMSVAATLHGMYKKESNNIQSPSSLAHQISKYLEKEEDSVALS